MALRQMVESLSPELAKQMLELILENMPYICRNDCTFSEAKENHSEELCPLEIGYGRATGHDPENIPCTNLNAEEILDYLHWYYKDRRVDRAPVEEKIKTTKIEHNLF